MSGRGQDFVTVISGLQKIAEAAGKNRGAQIQNFLKYSSLKNAKIPEAPKSLKELTARDVTQKTFMEMDNAAVFGQVLNLNILQFFVAVVEEPFFYDQ